MAEISKITLSNNTTYDLKVYTDHIAPMQTKTYTGVIGTANSWAGATFFFGTIMPTNYYSAWYIKYRIYAEAAGSDEARASSEVTVAGTQDALRSYSAFNNIANTSYRPAYYHELYRAKTAGISAGYGHALGVRLYSSWNPTTAANSRTFVIDILETYNCTFTFFNSMTAYASIPGTGTTNYNTYSEMDFATQGLQETGDANDVNYQNREYYSARTAYSQIYRYQLLLSRPDGTLVPTNKVNNSVATTKAYNVGETFDPFGEIFWYNSTENVAAGGAFSNSTLYRQIMFDARYAFNIGGYNTTSLITANKPFYLKATPVDGQAKIDSTGFSQTLPTSEDGLLYIYLGMVYADTYPYRIVLSFKHPVFHYKNGAIRAVTTDSLTVDGHAVATSVGNNANIPTGAAVKTFIEGKGYITGGTNSTSSVTITPSTTDVYSMTSAGSVTAGTAASFTRGSFSGGSFTQGTDSFTANVPAKIDTSKFSGGSFTRGSFSGGSFTQGTDSFTANVPAKIDTSKFSGGSFTRGTFSGGSFTQGTDSFTANTPTVINTSKFSGGSFTRGSFSGGSLTASMDTADPLCINITFTAATHGADSFTAAKLNTGFYTAGTAASFTQGTDKFTAATHAADSFTAAKLNSGFYTAGTAASFTQGTDKFTAATHAADSFTAAKLNSGFYTAGTAASFTQGTDSFTAATHAADSFTAAKLNSGFYTAGTAASFTQGTDKFTAATHAADSFTANKPTAVTLPGRSNAIKAWTGYTSATAAAQTFTGTT